MAKFVVQTEFKERTNNYLREFRKTNSRSELFSQMVLDEVDRYTDPVVLDIGCGNGFDSRSDLQEKIAASTHKFIGIEPDAEIELGPYVDEAYACLFEDADIPLGSIDVAYAVMVLEHVAKPNRFWAKLFGALAEDGVFWGFTMDRRHYFTWVSQWTERLHLKDAILNRLHGKRGEDRYENYPTHYLANDPSRLRSQLREIGFGRVDCLSMNCVGQLDFYVPRALRLLSHTFDRIECALGLPGSILAVRVEKGPWADTMVEAGLGEVPGSTHPTVAAMRDNYGLKS